MYNYLTTIPSRKRKHLAGSAYPLSSTTIGAPGTVIWSAIAFAILASPSDLIPLTFSVNFVAAALFSPNFANAAQASLPLKSLLTFGFS